MTSQSRRGFHSGISALSEGSRDSRVVLITGGSSGIGLALAHRFAQGGDRVYEISRNARTHSAPNLHHLTGDVTDRASLECCLAQILEQEGRIDILFANAGYGIAGPIEETPEESWKHMIDTNLGGVIRIAQLVLPHMRRQGKGRILITSSLAAPIPIPFQSFYSLAKAALHSFCMTLALEAEPFGIQCASILPGDLHTGFTANRQRTPDSAYPRCAASLARMERDETAGAGPETFANLAWRICRRKRMRRYYTLGLKYVFLHGMWRILPTCVREAILRRLYA